MDQSNQICLGYQICDAAVINIADELLRDEMQIFIKTIDDKILIFEMKHSNKIRDVKMKIEEKTKLSANQQNLFYQGEILNDDDKTIDEYQICEKSVIDIISRLRGGMRIFIKTMDGKNIDVETLEGSTLTLEVLKSSKIIDIKREIQEKIGLLPDKQKLVYQAKILEDDKTIDEYQICDLSEIKMDNLDRMQIYAQTMDGRTLALQVKKSDKIIDIKLQIQEKKGPFPDEQILLFEGAVLKDDKTIDDYKIIENSVIKVVVRLRGGMQTLVKNFGGKTFSIGTLKSEEIINMKYKIQERNPIIQADDDKF